MPTSDSIKSEHSSSSSSEPEDHSSSQEMLHLSTVGDGAGVGSIPKPSPRLQSNNSNNDNNNPHKTRVVVCGLPAAGSDFAASAKPSRRRHRGGGPPASSNKRAKTSSPKSTTHTRQEAIDGGGNSDEANKAAKKGKVVACLHASARGQTTNNCRASLLRQGLLLVGESPSPNFVEKWNALLEVEMKLYLRRTALIQEQIQLLANIWLFLFKDYGRSYWLD